MNKFLNFDFNAGRQLSKTPYMSQGSEEEIEVIDDESKRTWSGVKEEF